MDTGKASPNTRRINHGRGHYYEVDGHRVDGVTTVIGDGIPKPALIDWASRTVTRVPAGMV